LQALASAAGTDRLLIRELDVRSRESLDQCLTTPPADFEPIDILFNNAGLALGMAKAHEALIEGWETMIETNVTGLSRVTRAVLPGMVKRNRGDILNMSSVAATYPYPGGNIYGATKAFVRQFSLICAQTCWEHGSVSRRSIQACARQSFLSCASKPMRELRRESTKG
jgi:3-hydroxy acid dehydrogenase/malonic semialdehyde reductase